MTGTAATFEAGITGRVCGRWRRWAGARAIGLWPSNRQAPTPSSCAGIWHPIRFLHSTLLRPGVPTGFEAEGILQHLRQNPSLRFRSRQCRKLVKCDPCIDQDMHL